MPSKFSFGSEQRSQLGSRQGSVAKLGFQPFKKTTFPEAVKEVQESPDSLPQVPLLTELETVSKRLQTMKLADQTMESQTS